MGTEVPNACAMANAHEHMRPPGDQGGHDDRLLVVATLLHKLDDEGVKPLEGFLGTVDLIGSVLNPHGHRQGRLQSWLTHFALLLKYERDERVWMLQRHCHGVDYCPTDVQADALVMGAQIRYAPNGPTAIVCNVATAERDWPTRRTWGHSVRRWNVWDRFDEERGRPYDFIGKNCQHFAYDFYKYTLEHERISKGSFEQYTDPCQREWRARV